MDPSWKHTFAMTRTEGEKASILIRDCTILSLLSPHEGSGLQQQDILIRGNRIDQVSSPGILVPPSSACVIIEGKGKLAIAGLINAHTHSPEHVLKATMPGMPTELWGIPLYSDFLPWSPRLTYLSALWGSVEQLKSGTTTVLDHLWTVEGVSREHMDAAMQAYQDVGIRATVAPFIEDQDLIIESAARHGLRFPSHPFVDRFSSWPVLDSQLSELDDFFAAWHQKASGRLRCMLGPVGIQWCSEALMAACLELSERYKTGIHLHALETQMQANILKERVGHGGIAHLQEMGLLKAGTSLAHAIWLEAGDLELLAQTRTSIIHNPISNMRLGCGRFPLAEAHRYGVPIALGSDGAASNDSQDMFSVLKVAGLIHNQEQEYRHWPQAQEIFEMATRGGAVALGYENDLGALQAGKLADIVLLDLNTAPFIPLRDPLLHLVYCEASKAVDTVIVDGTIVMQHRKSLLIDEDALRQELQAICNIAWPGFQAYVEQIPTTHGVLALLEQLRHIYTKEDPL